PSTARNVVFAELPLDGATLAGGIPRPDLIQSIQAPAGSHCDIVAPGEAVAPRCSIPSLGPGATSTFQVPLAIPADYKTAQTGTPTLTNAAIFETADIDSDPDNNDLVALAPAPITPRSDIAITKVGPAATVTGGEVDYFIHVSNAGPSAASGV